MAQPDQSPFTRRLAAIMVADVVGFSRLMEKDEVGTLRQVRLLQKTCIDPITSSHGGRLIKSTGDGFLFEFSSASDAIQFALAFQTKLYAMMTSVPEPARLVVRIGVHAGDILSVDDDVFGNGVNIAARLETLCTPGAVCMSEVVQQQLHKQMHLTTIDRGEHLVKNISRPIRVYEIDSDTIRSIAPISSQQLSVNQSRGKVRGRRAPILALAAFLVAAVCGGAAYVLRPTPGTMQPLGGKHFSIAVLPFTTLNDDGKADPFADALVDNLTTDLSISFPASSVIASASTFTYRGKDVGLRRMSQELGAKYLLTGSVRKTAEHLRVNVHLVDGDSGGQLWSDAFDGSLADVNALQDQITIGLANTLSLQLIRLEADRQLYTTNASALDLTFRAIAIMTRDITMEKADLAERDLRQALQLDPGNLLAMKCLSEVLLARAAKNISRANTSTEADFKEPRDLLARIRAQDPRYPGLHTQLGFVALLFDKPQEAIEHYRTELANDPSAASTYAALGLCYIKIGRAQDALPLIERSVRLDPRNPGIAANHYALALAYFALEQYPEAIKQAEHAYAANPNIAENLFLLAASNALIGNKDEALSKLSEARKLEPDRSLSGMRRNIAAKEPANVALANRFIDGLQRAGLPD